MEYLKIVLFVLLGIVVLYLLIWSLSPLLISTKKEYNTDSKFYRWLLYSSTGIASKILRIKFHTTGMEKVPTDTRFLFVCNHRSNYDPILSWYVFRKFNLSFISKPENFKVPIYGRIIRRCCFMAINRKSPRESMQTILRAIKLVKDDQVSIAVYPEGTRSKTLKLLKFHNGVFKVAHKAGIPVVVVTVKGTELIKKQYPFHRSHVYFDVLETIPTEKVKELGTDGVSAYARKLMLDSLGEVDSFPDKKETETTETETA